MSRIRTVVQVVSILLVGFVGVALLKASNVAPFLFVTY